MTVELSAELTQQLLQELPRSWRTRINDALLTAVLRAVNAWTGGDSITINLEGHGREELFDDIDVSRTVGWFTSLYPVLLRTAAAATPGETLRHVKEALRAIPDNGIGYGILRYLNNSETIEPTPDPEIGFNYLGQYDQVTAADGLFQTDNGPRGREQSPSATRPHLLDIHCVVTHGRLQLSLIYSDNVHKEATVAALAHGMLAELEGLIELLRAESARRVQAGRFPARRCGSAYVGQTRSYGNSYR